MDLRTADSLISQIEGQIESDYELLKILRWLQEQALRYAALRAKYSLSDEGERREMEDERTRAHNALIDNCNILSRAMAKKGLDDSWRRVLGDDRKVIGDFACYIHAILGVRAR